MKRKNTEAMERALGIIEGLSFVGESSTSEALVYALELLQAVLDDERERRK